MAQGVSETSVLMAVFNCEDYLPAAISSILGQTYGGFEFIIVDDGSTDRSSDILSRYAKNDGRIVILRNDRNIGLAASLNRGLKAASGRYIARMDADDISDKRRLEIQIGFLRKHDNVDILGAYVHSADQAGRVTGTWHYPSDDVAIKWQMAFSNPIAHPSAVFKKQAVLSAGGYDESFVNGQDYDLWTRMAAACRFAAIKKPLVKWRSHPGSNTAKNVSNKAAAYRTIVGRQAGIRLGRRVSEDEISDICDMESGLPAVSAERLSGLCAIINDMAAGFPGLPNRLALEKLLKLVAVNFWEYSAESMRIYAGSAIRYFSPAAFFDPYPAVICARSLKRKLSIDGR